MIGGRGARRPGRGLSRFATGLLALVLIAGFSLGAWFRFNPFEDKFELNAIVETTSNLAPRSPVRIAGIDVGKVTAVERAGGGHARVTMELEERGLPVHSDAELKVRPRIFFEGNFFVDLFPGSPSARTLDDGETLPPDRASSLVSIADVLAALKSDTRKDLQTLVKEYAIALESGGAEGLHKSLPYLEPAYRDLALTADAALGEEPDEDLRRVIRGTQQTVAALDEDQDALKGLVTNLGVTAGALAREDVALEAALPELRDTLRTAQPALASLNAAFPPLRTLAREARPGVRRLGPTIRAALPLVREARALVGPRELRGATRVLRRRIPDLFDLVDVSVPLFEQGRAASRCTEKVLVPLVNKDFPDPDFPENTGTVNQKLQRSFVGLAGESRTVDANQSYFHSSAIPPPPTHRPAPPPGGVDQLPPRRPGVPCETQEPPNLDAPGVTVLPNGTLAPLTARTAGRGTPSLAIRRRAFLKAKPLVIDWQRRLERRRQRALAEEGRLP